MSYAEVEAAFVLKRCEIKLKSIEDEREANRNKIVDRDLIRMNTGLLGWVRRKLGYKPVTRHQAHMARCRGDLFSKYRMQDLLYGLQHSQLERLEKLAEIAHMHRTAVRLSEADVSIML